MQGPAMADPVVRYFLSVNKFLYKPGD